MRTASIRSAITWFVFHALRTLELLLPVWCLRALFGPAAFVVAGYTLLRAPTIRHFDRLPISWQLPRSRVARLWRIWRQRAQVNVTKLLTFWPDRLDNPRWQQRARCPDLAPLEQMVAGDRPVILAILHYGPLTVLSYWLRARGLEAAFLVASPTAHLSISKRYKQMLSDQASGLADVPHVLDAHHLRAVLDFLQPQRLLIVAVDGGAGKSHLVRNTDFSLRMAIGTMRLAARVNAIVVPCLVRADRPMAFSVHLGAPVPEAWVVDRNRHPAACSHLLHGFLPILRAYPEQCNYDLLVRIQSSPAPPALSDGTTVETEGANS